MKKLFATLGTALLLAQGTTALAQTAPISISGTVTVNAKTIYLQNYSLRTFHVIDSAKVVDGKFSFNKNLKYPEVYGLAIDTSALAAIEGQQHPDQQTLPLFLDTKNAITVVFDTVGRFKNAVVTGSPGNDVYQEFRKGKAEQLADLLKKYPASVAGPYVLYRTYSSSISPEELKTYLALLDESLNETQYVADLNKLVETAPIGSKAIDFTLPDINGKKISLSSKLGKNYVLLEFWASWCPVCRKENPNVVKNFKKYKDKGFDIFAVSLDRNKAAWLKGIKDFGLNWTQVSDLRLWDNSAAQLYGFRALPSNVLIDPQGVIIAKNLAGEELDNKLEELLGGKIASK